ncbi:MAG TPA: kelch repeat-containing protein [Bacteroidia bacterium]|nr:kelch repeat-containing protein [Bacteroidia bacterium]
MKIRKLLLATFISATSLVKAQVNQFTWINGSTSVNQAADYGTQGVPSTTNSPGGREAAMTWTDGSGNFWLFGGIDQTSAYKGDLWRYNPSTNEWTWVHGSNSSGAGAPQISATAQGVPSISNTPGCRYGSCTWTSLDGNTLYLFGGWGMTGMGAQGLYNNLWSYDIANNTWTYLKGALGMTQAALYTGASGSLTPGSKQGAVGWTGPDGKLYLFGGNGYASGATSGLTNDLWKYDPATNNWIFINGNTTINPISGTSPGGMTEAVAFYDGTSNKAYITGGLGRTWNSTAGRLNDVWSFNMTTNSWSYESGNSGNVDDGGIYGAIGVEQAGVFPRSRDRAKGVVLKSGRFAYFGGYGWNGSSMDQFGDYWEFNPYSKNWAWMRGNVPTTTNQNGVYGTLGVSSATAMPGERFASAVWKDNQGNLWLYGGTGLGLTGTTSGRLSDLWKYTPECNIPASAPSITYNNNSACVNGTVVLTATATGAVKWYPSSTSSVILSSNNTYSITGLSAGTYTYYAETSNGCGVQPTRTPASFTINPAPSISVPSKSICVGQSTVVTASGALSYTWSTGANSSTISVAPTNNTTYTVTGKNSFNCTNTQTVLVAVNPLPTVSVNNATICAGECYVINPTGANTYTVGFGTNTVCPTSNQSYTVRGMSAAGCLSSNTATCSITVNAKPYLAVFSGSVCSGKSYSLNPSGASSYTVIGESSTVVTPSITTTYSIIGSSTLGCLSNVYLATVTVAANPTIALSSVGGNTWCTTQTNTFTATGASNYSWSSSGAFFLSAIQGSVVTAYVNNLYNIANVTLTVTGTQNGCSTSLVNTYTSYPIPSINITGGPSSYVCPSTSFSLTVNGSNFSNVQWTDPAGVNNATTTTASFNAYNTTNNTINTIYTVTATSPYGCSNSSATKTITVSYEPINPSIQSPGIVCSGSSAVLTATAGFSNGYAWNTGATTNTISVSPTVTTSYTVVITAATSCTTSVVSTLSVSPCTGIHDNSIDEILEVYPNPTDNIIHFNVLSQDLTTIEIIDINGKIIYRKGDVEAEQVFDMSNLQSGVYFIRATINQKSYNKKIIKL